MLGQKLGFQIAKNSGKMTTGLANLKSNDPMYQALYNANPYTNLSYNKSPFQGLLSMLGFRTDYDRWLEEAQVNKNEYDAQVASIQQQNEFNSEANKVAMMKQAGENPDLLGTSGVSDSASPVQDVNGMSSGVSESGEFGEITSKLWNFGTSILSLYQVGIGLAKDMMTFKQMKSAVDGQDIDLAKKFMSFANDVVFAHSPDRPFDNDESYHEHRRNVTDILLDYPRQLRMNRKQRRIWNRVISYDYLNSDNFKRLTENWKSSTDSLNTISRTPQFLKGSRLEGFDEWKSFNVVSSELGDLAKEVYNITQKRFKAVSDAEISKAGVDKQISDAQQAYRDTQTGLNFGQVQALGQGTSNMMNYYNNSVEKAMNRSLQKIAVRLENDADNGDLLSAGLLLAFNIFRLSNFKIK